MRRSLQRAAVAVKVNARAVRKRSFSFVFYTSSIRKIEQWCRSPLLDKPVAMAQIMP
jgi:hypothetical protein